MILSYIIIVNNTLIKMQNITSEYDICFDIVTNRRANHRKPRRWKSMLIHQESFTAQYTQHKLYSMIHNRFVFEICILQALNMPLIRCTNVFFQGRLSRHITSPSKKPGNHMGKVTPVWQLSSSHRCHQM